MLCRLEVFSMYRLHTFPPNASKGVSPFFKIWCFFFFCVNDVLHPQVVFHFPSPLVPPFPPPRTGCSPPPPPFLFCIPLVTFAFPFLGSPSLYVFFFFFFFFVLRPFLTPPPVPHVTEEYFSPLFRARSLSEVFLMFLPLFFFFFFWTHF